MARLFRSALFPLITIVVVVFIVSLVVFHG